MTGTLLPLPADDHFQFLIDEWPEFERVLTFPRSRWLGDFEDALRLHYPSANSDSLTLTARHYAPFPLSSGHDVP